MIIHLMDHGLYIIYLKREKKIKPKVERNKINYRIKKKKKVGTLNNIIIR